MKKILFIIIPIIAVLICSTLAFTPLDKKLADYFQRTLKTTEESPEVLMINIDDDAISKIGTFPFSRSIYAKMLDNLKELGVSSVVFDLNFLDKSEAKVREDYVDYELPSYISDCFSNMNYTFEECIDGYNSSSKQDLLDYYESMSELYEQELVSAVLHTKESADQELADSIRNFENVYLTLTFENEQTPDETMLKYLEDEISLKNIDASEDTITPEYSGVQPAIYEFISQAKGAGFVNENPSQDGYLRNVHLVYKYNGKYYPQLVLMAVLEKLGNPKLIITDDYIKAGDLVIPRSEDGSVILKYPKNKRYRDYNTISLANIYFLSSMEDTYLKNLEIMNDNYFFEDLEFEENPYDLWEAASFIHDTLSYGEDEENGITYENYIYYRNKYFEASKAFLVNENEQYFCEMYPDDVDYVHDLFSETTTAFYKFIEAREKYEQKVKNAICIVGTNASSTTDKGVIQYQEDFPRPGLHYTLANMLLAGDFVDDSPIIISIIVALIMSLIYSIVSKTLKGNLRQIVVGLIAVFVTGGGLILYFMISKQYIGAVIPLASVFLSFVATVSINFLTASNEKKFITNAFSQCLSKEVVNEIVENPSSFKLGGQRLEMTAMFTDIQKFSGFSELLSASQLVSLLNYYLTKMSDIIMDERGTVDKYEGDAIIALVGAPVKMEDHAARACRAAIKMKKIEQQMNLEIQEIASKEKPALMEQDLYDAFKIMVENKRELFTRIGLNSGEMIAGYMGSENKKNYTMMGNNVNLASRLEGVNKQYSTGGIMISAATQEQLGEEFVLRSLDRVRVVNVNTPIRLFELIDEKQCCDERTIKYYKIWEVAMQKFESKDYAKALEIFKGLSKEKPQDKVALYYISLIEKYFIKGKYPLESDNIGVVYNPEDGVFKLLQK